MIKALSGFILKLFGWSLEVNIPKEVRKYVMIVAPHTSNWDFVIGWLAFNVLGLPTKFLIKKEAFFWPLGKVLRKMGGIPIDRSKSNNVIMEVAHLFSTHDDLIIIITPEGTRKYTKNWKKGYYYIAEYAKVPIAVAYIDYRKKMGGISFFLTPSGDYNKDFEKIRTLYYDKQAKYPEKFNLSPMYRNKA
ncbi:MAG: 1-acyl-sn-glycerol-3-phosphate acyltransferase [Bacteroidota bacterium]|nr:1-acyl-sn-glycerol-3-phosphate acyltransferase [Bacteroidota bacterium]